MVPFTLFVAGVAGLLLSKRWVGDYFSPPAVYQFFWCMALGFLTLDWVSYDPMGSRVWIAMGLGYLGFMGGCLLPFLYAAGKRQWLTAEPVFPFTDRQRFERALLMLFLLGIAGFLIQLAHLQAQIGLGTFLSAPMEAREQHTNVKYLGFFNILNVANFVLALMYLTLYRRPAKWVIWIMLWALATTFVTTDRTRFFYMVIWSFFIVAYTFRRVRLTPKMMLGAAMTGFALFGFFMLIAKIYAKQAFEDNMEFVKLDRRYAVVVDPYIYLTGSFPVLQAFLEDHRPPSWGKATFEPIVKLIESVYPEMEREVLVGKFYRVPIELNACTYLEPYYKDFGTIGLLIGPFLTGFLCAWVYLAMRQRKTLFTTYFAALLSFCVTISIFVNHFTQIATWYFVLVGYAVHRYCHRQEPQPREVFREGIFRF